MKRSYFLYIFYLCVCRSVSVCVCVCLSQAVDGPGRLRVWTEGWGIDSFLFGAQGSGKGCTDWLLRLGVCLSIQSSSVLLPDWFSRTDWRTSEWARTGRDRKKKKKKQKAVVAVEDLKPLTDGTNSGNKTGPAVTDQLIFRPHVFAGPPDTPSIAFRHFPTVQPVTTTDLWCTLLPGKFGGKSLKYIAAIVVSFARWIHTVMETVRLSSARTREIYKK